MGFRKLAAESRKTSDTTPQNNNSVVSLDDKQVYMEQVIE